MKKLIVHLLDEHAPLVAVYLRALLYRYRRAVEVVTIENYVKPGDYALDIGARRGLFTLILREKVGAAGRVDAFEPFAPNMKALRAVFGKSSNIVLRQVALSSSAGEATLTVPKEGGLPQTALGSIESHLHLQGDVERVSEPLSTLDQELAQRTRPVAFIKCDIEGHELEALKGAVNVLKADHPVVLMEIEQRHSREPISTRFEFLQSLGYRAYFLPYKKEKRPIEEFDPQTLQRIERAGTADYVNMFLFLPQTGHGKS